MAHTLVLDLGQPLEFEVRKFPTGKRSTGRSWTQQQQREDLDLAVAAEHSDAAVIEQYAEVSTVLEKVCAGIVDDGGVYALAIVLEEVLGRIQVQAISSGDDDRDRELEEVLSGLNQARAELSRYGQ